MTTTILGRLSHFFSSFKDLVPMSIVCFREGYKKQYLYHDLFAGITVGLISLPLVMAFAIGAGATPESGLYTAIVAGFLISLLGGSRVRSEGPRGRLL